jgi:hypothetical protein
MIMGPEFQKQMERKGFSSSQRYRLSFCNVLHLFGPLDFSFEPVFWTANTMRTSLKESKYAFTT